PAASSRSWCRRSSAPASKPPAPPPSAPSPTAAPEDCYTTLAPSCLDRWHPQTLFGGVSATARELLQIHSTPKQVWGCHLSEGKGCRLSWMRRASLRPGRSPTFLTHVHFVH